MGYLVELKHYRPCYRKGDLEAELVIEHVRVYNTKRAAKQYIENMLLGKNVVYREYHKGKPSYCKYITGKTWIHENTGEKCEEYYMFVLTKV